jgi:hypothetical protein
MKNLPEVWEVEWVDSTSTHGWEKNGEARELQPDISTTVGFLVADDTKRIVISSSTVHMPESEYGNHARFNCPQAIPKCAIRKARRIRKARD